LLKQWLIRLGIFGYFFPDVPKNMLEEWHLHAFSWKLFKRVSQRKLEVMAVKKVPFSWLPLRYIVRCSKVVDEVSRPSTSLRNKAK
jgi:hypothetical protein